MKTRRDFFKALGQGIVVLLLAETGQAQDAGGRRRGSGGGGPRGGQRPAELSAWLHIGEDGTITVYTGKVEVGQNIRTSLSQAVAEELRTPVAAIKMIMADTDLVPFDGGTAGSRSTPDMGSQLHRVGAAAREALLDLAAERFQADRTLLAVADGKVTRTDTKESVTFGDLTKGQKLTRSVEGAAVTPPDQWKIAGTSVLKVDGRDFVTGKHKYSSDIRREGMVFGKVLRPAAFEATLASVDMSQAEAMEGVTVVHEGNFIGVTAPTSHAAARAAEAIKAEWTTKLQPSRAELFDSWKKTALAAQASFVAAPVPAPGEGVEAQVEHRLQRTYTIAYIAHTPARATSRGRGMEGWKAHRLDRHAAAFWRRRASSPRPSACRIIRCA